MGNKGWDSHPSGGTAVFPVLGIKTGTAAGGKAGVLRLEYGTEPTMEKREAKQFVMSPQLVRTLSERLAKLADRLEAAEDGTETLN